MSENAAPCERCPLQPPRAVASRGPVPARVLMLSGAPRYHEEHDGVAFASPAFERLQEMLAAADIDPAQIHYATVTGCRPPYQRPLRGEEIGACGPRLDTVVSAVEPEVVVVCGPDVVAAMLPGVTLARSHGELIARGRRRYFPIRHPYAALHYDGYLAEVMDDLRRLGALLSSSSLEPTRALDELATGRGSDKPPVEATIGAAHRQHEAATMEIEAVNAESVVEIDQGPATPASPTLAGQSIDAQDGPDGVGMAAPATDTGEATDSDPDEPAQLSLF